MKNLGYSFILRALQKDKSVDEKFRFYYIRATPVIVGQ